VTDTRDAAHADDVVTARWADIAEIRVGDRDAEVRTRSGRRRRIDLTDMENAAQVRTALLDAQHHHDSI
jgi:hypothetical protein